MLGVLTAATQSVHYEWARRKIELLEAHADFVRVDDEGDCIHHRACERARGIRDETRDDEKVCNVGCVFECPRSLCSALGAACSVPLAVELSCARWVRCVRSFR